MSSIIVKPGTLALVPLDASTGALCLVSHVSSKRRRPNRLIYLYAIDERYPLTKRGLCSVDPERVIYSAFTGEGDIALGDWPVCGELSGFKQDEWPLPPQLVPNDGVRPLLLWYDAKTLEVSRSMPAQLGIDEAKDYPPAGVDGGGAFAVHVQQRLGFRAPPSKRPVSDIWPYRPWDSWRGRLPPGTAYLP